MKNGFLYHLEGNTIKDLHLADLIVENSLGIDMVVSYPQFDYRGATIMVVEGVTNIWINTINGYIHSSWDSLDMKTPFVDKVGLDDRLEEKLLEVR